MSISSILAKNKTVGDWPPGFIPEGLHDRSDSTELAEVLAVYCLEAPKNEACPIGDCELCRDLSDVAKGGDGAKSEAATQNSPGF